MKKVLYLIFLILSFLAALVNGFAIVNTMVSIKYETNNPSDCISNVTGIDLCAQLDKSKLLTIVFSLAFIILLVTKKWIIKPN
ncbi:hypothetical protein [Draconibacterium sediminis]|uniref:hypothetical protein n=1 Tax=Draconibacterium sediminis TaxID=1544798 RepID=UPI0026EFF16A|nr:hypothetical protein [Draconibacterium sediminis]